MLHDMENSTVVDILRNPLIFTFTLLTFVTLSFSESHFLNEKQIWIETEYLEEKVSYEGHKKVGNIHNSLTRNLLIYYAILSTENIPDFGAKMQMRIEMK